MKNAILLTFIFATFPTFSFAAEVARVSEWNQSQEVLIDEFFLKMKDFPMMYRDAQTRFELYKAGKLPGKEIKAPAEQLSPKGLALMSYIYAQVDNDPAQPLVSDSIESLHHISKLMDDARPGTVVTLIFQPAGKIGSRSQTKGVWANFFASVHKTTVRLERQEDGLLAIGMDGTNNTVYPELVADEIAHSLEQNAAEKKRKATDVFFYMGKAETDSRQKSFFECGIFATKDARELNRDLAFQIDFDTATEESVKDNLHIYTYTLPTVCLKSAQSKTDLAETLEELGETVVTRKGKTLAEKIDQFGGSYAQHYAEKYNELVKNFVAKHNAEEVKLAVSTYNAHAMTAEKLADIYGPKNTEVPQSHSARIKELIQQHETFIKKASGKTPEQQTEIKTRTRVQELRKKFEK